MRLGPAGRRSIRAIFARGGTSNGLVVWKHHLPPKDEWPDVLPALMGSPDPFARQLNGMGSGISSTSKICILSRPADPAVADVDFTFVQVGVRDGKLDLAGNCGNMVSIVGPVAWDAAEHAAREDRRTGPIDSATVRIHNTNTGKLVRSTFRVSSDAHGRTLYDPAGPFLMDGVPAPGSRVNLEFVRPGGATTGRTLPTGNPVDTLHLSGDGETIEASLVDVSNPGVFVRAADVGVVADQTVTTPAAVDANPPLLARLERIRRAGAARMGLDPDTQSVPKIVLVFPPPAASAAAAAAAAAVNLGCLALSMGQAHKAVPLTLAMCLGAAARLPGTIPHRLAAGLRPAGPVVIGHPAGTAEVRAEVEGGEVAAVRMWRTARVLMAGDVYY